MTWDNAFSGPPRSCIVVYDQVGAESMLELRVKVMTKQMFTVTDFDVTASSPMLQGAQKLVVVAYLMCAGSCRVSSLWQ
jgi:hypothetical protein